MSPEEQALAIVLGLLPQSQIPYMLTGSVATSYHGRPRARHDADIVIDPTAEQLEGLVAALAVAGFYVDADAARRALDGRGFFNAIEGTHACKIDLIVKRGRPFSHEAFERRLRVNLPFAQDVFIVTPEDAVPSKLEWARRSGASERLTWVAALRN